VIDYHVDESLKGFTALFKEVCVGWWSAELNPVHRQAYDRSSWAVKRVVTGMATRQSGILVTKADYTHISLDEAIQ
jgi:hypothetical protein